MLLTDRLLNIHIVRFVQIFPGWKNIFCSYAAKCTSPSIYFICQVRFIVRKIQSFVAMLLEFGFFFYLHYVPIRVLIWVGNGGFSSQPRRLVWLLLFVDSIKTRRHLTNQPCLLLFLANVFPYHYTIHLPLVKHHKNHNLIVKFRISTFQFWII